MAREPRAKTARKRRTAGSAASDQKYDLVLFIAGATERSRSALANVKGFGERALKGRYRLSVVDLYQQPGAARGQDIVAVPTLVKRLPLPLRRVVGDLSDEDRVLVGLDLVPNPPREAQKK